MSTQDRIKTAIESISQGLAAIETSDDWIKYLAFNSKFYNYSYNNIILIMMQRPNASYVAGYTKWRELGRFVKRGEKGIQVLCPCLRKVEVFKEPEDGAEYNDKEAEKHMVKKIVGFKIGYVYDLSQTDGDDSILPVLVTGLVGSTEEEKMLYDSLFDYVSKKYTVKEADEMSAKGSFNIESQVITIKSDLDYKQKIKTILHELSHAYDFMMHPDDSIPRNKRELIAESSAYVISLRLGVDTSSYSFSYIKSWLKEPDELKDIADSVQKIACKIITELAGTSVSAFSALKEDEES